MGNRDDRWKEVEQVVNRFLISNPNLRPFPNKRVIRDSDTADGGDPEGGANSTPKRSPYRKNSSKVTEADLIRHGYLQLGDVIRFNYNKSDFDCVVLGASTFEYTDGNSNRYQYKSLSSWCVTIVKAYRTPGSKTARDVWIGSRVIRGGIPIQKLDDIRHQYLMNEGVSEKKTITRRRRTRNMKTIGNGENIKDLTDSAELSSNATTPCSTPYSTPQTPDSQCEAPISTANTIQLYAAGMGVVDQIRSIVDPSGTTLEDQDDVLFDEEGIDLSGISWEQLGDIMRDITSINKDV